MPRKRSLCSQGSGATAGAQPFRPYKEVPPTNSPTSPLEGPVGRSRASGPDGRPDGRPDDLISYQSPPSQVNACHFSIRLSENGAVFYIF